MPGKYVISVEPEDYVGWQEELVVKVGAEGQTIKRELAARVYRSKVRVASEPGDGVRVYLDDVQIGVTPLADVELDTGRRYLFRFERDGYDSWVRYITLRKGEVLELKPRMEKVTANRETRR